MGIFGLKKREKQAWNSIQPGDKVKISLGQGYGEDYFSSVDEINEFYIYIKTPNIGKALLDVSPDTEVNIEVEVFNPQNGKIRFSSKVTGQEWFREQRIKIASPRKLSWIQLRRYRRIEVSLNVEFSLVSEKESSVGLNLADYIHTGLIMNISEGGALLVIDKFISITKGAYLNAKIEFSPDSAIRAKCRVNRIESGEAKYGWGVEFIRMNPKDKELLRSFIFNTLSKIST
ncbi:MAG: hypothetical protein GF375_03645 [Candidatus Omnitrophica bacterium]|nr:hypothetical protein [Candidatus Omnitrophota bacterium]MBD3269153.1 hypothetical protein [Candidatus Omnitrophota bacterium]